MINQPPLTAEQIAALLPCPFCGSADIVSGSSLYPFYLCCRQCFAKGPREGSETQGQKWNTRAESVALREQLVSTKDDNDRLIEQDFSRGNELLEAWDKVASLTTELEAARGEVERNNNTYTGALLSLKHAAPECECEHDNENCCAVVGEFCARCWAHVALEGCTKSEEVVATADLQQQLEAARAIVKNLFALLTQSANGDWCFNSLSHDWAKFQEVIKRFAALPGDWRVN